MGDGGVGVEWAGHCAMCVFVWDCVYVCMCGIVCVCVCVCACVCVCVGAACYDADLLDV